MLLAAIRGRPRVVRAENKGELAIPPTRLSLRLGSMRGTIPFPDLGEPSPGPGGKRIP